MLCQKKTFKCLSQQLMHWDSFKQDIYSTVGEDGGVGLARYEPALLPHMPDHKGFKIQ